MAQEPELTRAYLNPAENVALGIAGGCFETAVHMPLLTWKITSQEGRPLPKTFGGWYRGVFAQCGSVAPITGLQVVANGVFSRIISGGTRDMTDLERIGSAMGAGAFSSIIYSPADLLTIHQQKLSKAPLPTIQHIAQEHGYLKLYRGISSCAVREAIYTCGYLGLGPVLADKFKEERVFSTDLACNLGASVVAGVLASITSHPVDTAKTVYQADLTGAKYTSASRSFMLLVKEQGVSSLYLGGAARMARNISAFFLVGLMREKLIDYKTAHGSLL